MSDHLWQIAVRTMRRLTAGMILLAAWQVVFSPGVPQ